MLRLVEGKVDTWRDERDALPVEFERNETRKETRNERNAQEIWRYRSCCVKQRSAAASELLNVEQWSREDWNKKRQPCCVETKRNAKGNAKRTKRLPPGSTEAAA